MSPSRRTPLVFVVDDDAGTRALIRGILKNVGYEVLCASDRAGALDGIREHRPDLILLDVNLLDGSGFDVCRQIQREPASRHTPVIFISADGDVASKIKAFVVGGVDYIPKPFAGQEVVVRVSTHLRLKHAYEALERLQAERVQGLAVAQQALMPTPVDLPEGKFRVLLKQMRKAGGDFYDVIPVGNQVIDYVVADASGHDLGISVWTAALKALLNEFATPAHSPLEVLRSINGSLCRILPEGIYFTLIYARLNRHAGSLVLVNAGHPPAVIVARDHPKPLVVRQTGDVVGTFPDASFESTEITVQPGDRIFLFTDGLIEPCGSRDIGLRLVQIACAEHRKASLDAMIGSIAREATTGSVAGDDLLLMGIEV